MIMPDNIPTTVGLLAGFTATTVAMVRAVRRLNADDDRTNQTERWLVLSVTLGLVALLIYRAFAVNTGGWKPLQSHVDGLLLLTTLMGCTTFYFQYHQQKQGISIFALPLLALMLLWAICASWWSWRPFNIDSIWNTFHLLCVYAGTGVVTLGAGAGLMYLFVDKQLKSRTHTSQRYRILGRLASLEMVERIVINAGTGGFVLITLALISGVVIAYHGDTSLGVNWWFTPKVLLTVVAWVIYMLVMHVKFAPMFRGKRAATLTIVGFLLILVILGIAQILNNDPDANIKDKPKSARTYHISHDKGGHI